MIGYVYTEYDNFYQFIILWDCIILGIREDLNFKVCVSYKSNKLVTNNALVTNNQI